MKKIFALVEHRQGEIRDISFELLTCGRQLAEKNNSKLTAIIFGENTENLVEKMPAGAVSPPFSRRAGPARGSAPPGRAGQARRLNGTIPP